MSTVIALILVGAVLLFLETLLPGLIVGIIGFACVVAGVVMAYVNLDLQTANLVLLVVFIGLAIGTVCWLKYFPESRVAKVFISQGKSGESRIDKPELLDQTGTAFTDLRPSGTALINGRRIDVVTEGAMVERGTPVKVVAVEGFRVVVRAT